MRIHTATTTSPVGRLAVAWTDDETIVGIHMDIAESRTTWETEYVAGKPMEHLKKYLAARFDDAEIVRGARDAAPMRALAAYFAGDLGAIDGIGVDPGGTGFQAAVWSALRAIPAGETKTYGDLATSVDHPGSARAVGGAVGANPIPIVIPCHRVVGSDGRLTGFGGGLERKQWLLRHEGCAVAERPEQMRLV